MAKQHKPGCPRLQFWDAGQFEAPCECDDLPEPTDTDAEPADERTARKQGTCRACGADLRRCDCDYGKLTPKPEQEQRDDELERVLTYPGGGELMHHANCVCRMDMVTPECAELRQAIHDLFDGLQGELDAAEKLIQIRGDAIEELGAEIARLREGIWVNPLEDEQFIPKSKVREMLADAVSANKPHYYTRAQALEIANRIIAEHREGR